MTPSDKISKINLYNARPINLQLWSDRPEVHNATEAIFSECVAVAGIKRQHPRMKDCLKVVLLTLFTCHEADPLQYVRYSRRNISLISIYNPLNLSNEQISKAVDNLGKLGYVENTLGKWSPASEKRLQSRMRASHSLIIRLRSFGVLSCMAAEHQDTRAIILKNADKELIPFEPTADTRRMQQEMTVINRLLAEHLINLYMPDTELNKLKERMRTGKVPEVESNLDDEKEDQDETLRGSIDMTHKSLRRIFNNSNFQEGGRLYGGWWQSLPRDYRKYIRINRMNTVEVDFSAFHINLIYWLEKLPTPEDDLYTLEGFPQGTRDVVKKCLLIMINAKDRKQAMRAINDRVRGFKYKSINTKGRWKKQKVSFHEKDMIILPNGMSKVETIIDAFEHKHEQIKTWFFSGKGTTLQFWDSQIAVEILLMLAKKNIPALPLHDSFIVEEPHKLKLERIMAKAYYKVTGRYPNIDAKYSLSDENRDVRGQEEMEAHYQAKMEDGTYSQRFREEYSNYVTSYEEWKKVTGEGATRFYTRISAT